MIRAWWQDIQPPAIPIPNPGDIDQNDVGDAGVTIADILVRFPLLVGALILAFFVKRLWATTPGKVLIIGGVAVIFTLMVTR